MDYDCVCDHSQALLSKGHPLFLSLYELMCQLHSVKQFFLEVSSLDFAHPAAAHSHPKDWLSRTASQFPGSTVRLFYLKGHFAEDFVYSCLFKAVANVL